MKKEFIVSATVIAIGLILGTLITIAMSGIPLTASNNPEEIAEQPPFPIQQGSILIAPQDDVFSQADIVFLGVVSDIGRTQWNQDSGEQWTAEEGNISGHMLVHYLFIEVTTPFVGDIETGDVITFTIIGHSPIEPQYGEYAEHSLSIDDEAVFFGRNTQLAWQGGPRDSLVLFSHPEQSYYRLEADGLYHNGLHDEAYPVDQLVERLVSLRDDVNYSNQILP